jgi:hypothetical protein
VLDFVGQHRREFRYDRRFRALLGGSRRDVERAVEQQFPFLPAGCSMQLDRVATDVVLRSLREAIPTRWPQKVEELRSLRRDRGDLQLLEFLDESGLELEDVYDGSRSWSDLQEAAGEPVRVAGPSEPVLRRAMGRLLHVDDEQRVRGWRRLVALPEAPDVAALAERERRLLHMLVAQVADRVIDKRTSLDDAVRVLWGHPQVRRELLDLLPALERRIDHVHAPLTTHPSAPLLVHARYTRIEILTGMGLVSTARVPAWQSGVYEARPARAELFAFTLDKSSGAFSPTTRYRDYAISRDLIHWESQSSTRADSPTGLRYRHHERDGRTILLFTRLRADDRAFWCLGPATYESHVGERPMAITWRLHHSLPGDLYASFAAAVA